MTTDRKGILLTLIAAAGFGVAAPLSKFIYTYNLSANLMLTLRFLMASMILWGYIYLKRNKINYKVTQKQLGLLFLLGGIIYVLTTAFYFTGVKYIPVSIHVMIFYTYPLIVNGFTVFVFKDKIPTKQIFAMFISFIGLILIAFNGVFTINYLGMSFSLIAALGYSIYLMTLNIKALEKMNSLVLAAYTNTFSGLVFFLYSFIKKDFYLNIPLPAWLAIGLMATVSTAVAIIVLKKGIQLIGPAKASIIGTFEPLEGIILSVLFLKETLNSNQIIGIILIIFAIILVQSQKKLLSKAVSY
jgi:drug/metabolite transporter (DMT)-like permease